MKKTILALALLVGLGALVSFLGNRSNLKKLTRFAPVDYGADRLLAVLNSLRAASQENALKAVREDLRAFVGAADQFDDITMLGFVFRGPQ